MIVQIIVPFLGTLSIRCSYYNRDPKRDHNFDNHPNEGLIGSAGCETSKNKALVTTLLFAALLSALLKTLPVVALLIVQHWIWRHRGWVNKAPLIMLPVQHLGSAAYGNSYTGGYGAQGFAEQSPKGLCTLIPVGRGVLNT